MWSHASQFLPEMHVLFFRNILLVQLRDSLLCPPRCTSLLPLVLPSYLPFQHVAGFFIPFFYYVFAFAHSKGVRDKPFLRFKHRYIVPYELASDWNGALVFLIFLVHVWSFSNSHSLWIGFCVFGVYFREKSEGDFLSLFSATNLEFFGFSAFWALQKRSCSNTGIKKTKPQKRFYAIANIYKEWH